MSVKLTAAPASSGSFSSSHQWQINSPATVRTGSSAAVPRQNDDDNQASGMFSAVMGAFAAVLALASPAPSPVNQCVFARGYRISLRDGLLDPLISGQKVSLDEDPKSLLRRLKSGTKRIPFQNQGPWKGDDSDKRGDHVGTSGAAPEGGTPGEDMMVDQIPIADSVSSQTCSQFHCNLNPFCTRVTILQKSLISGSLTQFVTCPYP